MITCTNITNSYITNTGISIVYRKTDGLEVSCFLILKSILKSMLSNASLLFTRPKSVYRHFQEVAEDNSELFI